jgi:hypothetical protein
VGIDWVRSRPRTKTPSAEVAVLVQQQADAFQAMPFYWDIGPHVDTYEDPGDSQRGRATLCTYREASDRLRARLEPVADATEAFPLAWRVNVVLAADIFPPQTQRAALRTYPPRELPGLLSNVERYLNDVRAGRRPNYVQRLYLYRESRRLLYLWHALDRAANATVGRKNAWASKPAVGEVRDHIVALPMPTQHALPPWPDHGHDAEADGRHDPRHGELSRAADALHDATRRFNRAVPSNLRLSLSRIGLFRSYRDFLAQVHDPALDGFTSWVAETCRRRQGLFLDY